MAINQAQDASVVWGISLRWLSLFILVIQNSALVLTMRQSRTIDGPPYLSSTAVLLSEAVKLAISTTIYLYQSIRSTADDNETLPLMGPLQATRSRCYKMLNELYGRNSGMTRMLVPAVLYTIQNNLQFVAATNLDAVTFQVTYQCKILTTALLAVILLRQRLGLQKWIALVILTIGVAIAQLPSSSTASLNSEGNRFIGLAAVLSACVLSGLAGVYFEKIIKTGPPVSIWLCNIQLGTASIVIAGAGVVGWDYDAIRRNGFFQGYTSITVITVLIQALGGIIVALVVSYADNILKGFATSISILLSTVMSMWIFNYRVKPVFMFGAGLVLWATYLYSGGAQPISTPVPVDIDEIDDDSRGEEAESYEKHDEIESEKPEDEKRLLDV